MHCGLFRYPDVLATSIVFTYANDLWIIPKTGGAAVKISSPAGVESFPKFSPDGKRVAFTGNYDGNADAYMIPTTGGVPVLLTSHGYPDRVVDWSTLFKEGHGVDPDITVDENLGSMVRGLDPQLERAIAEIKTLLKTKEYKRPEPQKIEKRGL